MGIKFDNGELYTPDRAARIISGRMYDKQRPLSDVIVNSYSESMRIGDFSPVSNIVFAHVEGDAHKAGVCIDGQHTLHAIVRSGVDIVLPTSYAECATEEDRAVAYAHIDRNRARYIGDSIRALGMSDELELTPMQIRLIVASIRFAKGGWGVESNLNRKYSEDSVLRLVPWWANACRTIYDAISSASTEERRYVLRRPIFPIALITMHYQSESAFLFWRQVALSDGLVRDDPRRKAREHIEKSQRPTNATSARFVRDTELTRGVIHAWNAYHEGRKTLGYIKVAKPSGIVRILGTPYNGRQDSDFWPEWSEFS